MQPPCGRPIAAQSTHAPSLGVPMVQNLPGLNRRLFLCCWAPECAAGGAPAGTLFFLKCLKPPLFVGLRFDAVCFVLAMWVAWCTTWVAKLGGCCQPSNCPNLYHAGWLGTWPTRAMHAACMLLAVQCMHLHPCGTVDQTYTRIKCTWPQGFCKWNKTCQQTLRPNHKNLPPHQR